MTIFAGKGVAPPWGSSGRHECVPGRRSGWYHMPKRLIVLPSEQRKAGSPERVVNTVEVCSKVYISVCRKLARQCRSGC